MKPKYFLLFCLSVYILSTQYSTATVRYVSKTGTSQPPFTSWQTSADSIQKCINICQSGDTVYVANGVYKENLVINTQIFLSGLSMDSTLIDGRGLGRYTIDINSITYLENFRIFGKGTVESWAIRSYQTLNINSCNISDCGLAVGMVGVPCIMNKVIITNVTSYGFGGGCFSDTCNYFISNSVIILNAENTIGINTTIGGYYHITNNIILFAGTNSNSGHGISIGALRKVYINNNLISGFTDNIFIDTVLDTAIINNNLLMYQFSLSSGPASLLTGGNQVVVNNVVLSNNKNGIHADELVTSDYNIFWKNINNIVALGTIPTFGDSDRIADPMFADDTIPTLNGNYDFHLQKYSPAIDKGNPSILDKDGSRSDIGMYGGPFGETYTYQDLAPLAPRNISAVVDTNQILLKWNRNTEADTAYYKVYRDTVINFQIDSTKLISSPTDTFFVQLPPYNCSKYVYKITCVDNQGNESKPSEEVVVDLTSVSTDDYPILINDYFLYQNYPNPFNPSTKIAYKLKEGGYVKLYVYDIKGELISVLVNKEQNAGFYEVEFSVSSIKNLESSIKGLASGIYLYRIEVVGGGNIPVYTEMKKMLLIK